jgi:hypothetical protein
VIPVENPKELWLKEEHENARYLCLSFISDEASDAIFIYDKQAGNAVRLPKRFDGFSLQGLIDPGYVLLADYEISAQHPGDERGFWVLRLPDLHSIHLGLDGSDYQLSVEGTEVIGVRTISRGDLLDQVPYQMPIKQVLIGFSGTSK